MPQFKAGCRKPFERGIFPRRLPTGFIFSICRPVSPWKWRRSAPARPFAGIIIISRERFSTRSCLTPDCPGCMGNMTPLNALTSTSSHELAEAITDPIPGQGWYDDQQEKSAISAPGTPRRWVPMSFKRNGRIRKTPASEPSRNRHGEYLTRRPDHQRESRVR